MSLQANVSILANILLATVCRLDSQRTDAGAPSRYDHRLEKEGRLLQPEIIVLGVAVVAEAAVLGAVLTGLVRLRARLGSLTSARPDPSRHTFDNPVTASGHVAGNDRVAALVSDADAAAAAARLDALIGEAELLGEALVAKLDERLARYAEAPSEATADDSASSYPAAPMQWVTVPVDGAAEDTPAAELLAPTFEDNSRPMAGPRLLREEGAAVPAREPADAPPAGSWDIYDIQTAREKGMDPLGVALQRSLSARGARGDETRA